MRPSNNDAHCVVQRQVFLIEFSCRLRTKAAARWIGWIDGSEQIVGPQPQELSAVYKGYDCAGTQDTYFVGAHYNINIGASAAPEDLRLAWFRVQTPQTYPWTGFLCRIRNTDFLPSSEAERPLAKAGGIGFGFLVGAQGRSSSLKLGAPPKKSTIWLC